MAADANHREISPGVMRFIAEHVDTLEKLELLKLMTDSEGRWWDAASAAEALGMTTGAARQLLERFAAQNLLEIRVTGDVRYRFQPGDPRLEASAREFANAYRTNRLGILRLVTKSPDSLRDFADAFRIRRDDDR
jgi:hypothetical protein